MSILLTADLHLTDRPRDEYRMGIFKWMRKQQDKYDIEATFILGDLTDAKDRHSAKLVNAIVEGLSSLRAPVYILQGNHDYIDINNPFFGFLNNIDGIDFVTAPQVVYIGDDAPILMIPHQAKEWPDLSIFDDTSTYILIHQCIEGAMAEGGRRLSGLSPAPVAAMGARRVLAGDIHRPQLVGPVCYLGAPYNVRFGDDFEPRCCLLNVDTDEMKDIHYPAPRKRMLRVRDPDDIRGDKGDQVKVTVELTREEIPSWPIYKKAVADRCALLGLELYGVKMELPKKRKRERLKQVEVQLLPPSEVLSSFCNSESLGSKIRKAGQRLLEES